MKKYAKNKKLSVDYARNIGQDKLIEGRSSNSEPRQRSQAKMKSATIRKIEAINEVLTKGINKAERSIERLDGLKEIESKHNVSLLIEDHCISAWTEKTAITRKFI